MTPQVEQPCRPEKVRQGCSLPRRPANGAIGDWAKLEFGVSAIWNSFTETNGQRTIARPSSAKELHYMLVKLFETRDTTAANTSTI